MASPLSVVKEGKSIIISNVHLFGGVRHYFRFRGVNEHKVLRVIREVCRKYGVSYRLVYAIAKVESDLNPRAVSKSGARGVMQLMKETASDYGAKDLYDVRENVEAGVKFIKHLLTKYDGNVRLVLAAYNAGETSVDRYGGVPPYLETRRYIKKVMTIYNSYGSCFGAEIVGGQPTRLMKVNGTFTNIGGLW